MSIGRALMRQIAISTVVISAVFAAGFHTGTSATLSTMRAECAFWEGEWTKEFCVVSEISK